jgi:uncharacterized membrane protein
MDPGTPLPTTPAPPAAQSDSTAKIVYILYLVALVSGVTALIGVIMAYVNVGEAPEPLQTHYRFQIRTFWIALLYCIVSGLLTIVAIGALLFVLVAVWYVVRCAKGLQYLGRGQPYPNAATWLW